jgi:hypothetical protein
MTAALRRRWQTVLAAACVLGSVTVVACGSKPNPPAKAPPAAVNPNLLSDREVAAAKPGSPTQTLLRWWQAIQYHDVDLAADLTMPDAIAGPRRADFERAADKVAGALGKPRVLAQRAIGADRLVLRVMVDSFAAGKRAPVASAPFTFRFARRGGAWRIADMRYLLISAGQ